MNSTHNVGVVFLLVASSLQIRNFEILGSEICWKQRVIDHRKQILQINKISVSLSKIYGHERFKIKL